MKRDRLSAGACAELFLLRHPGHADCNLRFDLVAVRPWRLWCHLVDAWRLG